MNSAAKPAPWHDICCASMPVDCLANLADWRGRGEIEVTLAGDRAWIRWHADSEIVPELLAGRILAVEGVELFTERDGQWFRLGEHLPALAVPFRDGTAGVPLDRMVIPGRLSVLRPGGGASDPLPIRLVRDLSERERPATALRGAYDVFSRWADDATSEQLNHLQIAWRLASDGEYGDAEVLVLGSPGTVPLLPESVRYWGSGLLLPLGFRAEPDLPEAAIRSVAGAGEGDLAVMDEGGLELIARELFEPLTRAAVRLGRESSRRPLPEGGSGP